jgi:hypothetical protein
MDRRRLDQLHKTALSWGQWATGGRDRAGIQAAWPDIPTREALQSPVMPHTAPAGHRRATNGEKSLVTPHQPHSTPQRPQARSLTGRIDTQFTQIHGIAVRQPEHVKHIIVCLYFKALPFRDVSLITGLETSRISKLKYMFLDAINPIA